MKKFCVIDCEYGPMWRERSFGMMFQLLLEMESDETWDIINVDKGESLPPNLDGYDAVVITGSRHCCRDADILPWFDPLCDLIKDIFEQGRIKLYGGCFGCQIIAHALGGVVDKNPTGLFYLKAENVKRIGSFESIGLTDPEANSYQILVSHGDSVLSLPQNSSLLASSETCEYEIYSCGRHSPHNILAVQSHPEFELDYCVLQRIWPSQVEKKRLTVAQQEEYSIGFSSFTRDKGADQLISIIRDFLHS